MSRMKRLILISLLASLPFAAAAQPAAEEGAVAPAMAPAPEPAPENESREERLDRLFGALANAEGPAAERIASEITAVWARSGSDSMDLLLQRARKATEAEQYARARAHLSALTRLAPDFAEGWNASATVYFMQDEFWLSMEHIQRVLALEPRHFGALTGLAIILEHVDRKPAALAAWREAARLFPGMERAQEAIERLEKDVEGDDI